MNTATVTSKSNGSVYLVTEWPADTDPEDIRPGMLWVTDADGVQFSIRESKVTEGGEYVRTEPKVETEADRLAALNAANEAIAAANDAADRRENRRSYYLRTGR